MNREEREFLKEIQKDYLDEIRRREIKHAKEILRYRRIIGTIITIIIAFIFLWSMGYWFFGRDNNTAYVKQNNGNFVQQQINNIEGDK